MTIVSASHRTDIPAFYGEWFRARLRAGFARVANPFGGAEYSVALAPEAVAGFVFWTRNVAPFLDVLDEVRSHGTPFVVQHTVTGYPRILDRFVPAASRTIPVLVRLAERFGPEVVVWRYDPVVLTEATPMEFHLANLARIGRQLAGVTNEVVLSFVHPYAKTRAHMARLDCNWSDPDDDEKRGFIRELARCAAELGFRPTVCAQPALLDGAATAARCVDARRLERVAAGWGSPRAIAVPVAGNRPGCECHQSRDIGAYETCPHGCVYCYAVGSHERATAYYRAHDATADRLAGRRRSRPESH